MYQYKDIKQVHLEPTEKCQAVCPMCPRNIHGGKENPYIINAELSLEDCKKIFEPEFVKQLKYVSMCGNYGDPIFAKDTAEIMLYFRKNNPNIYLRMHTNGGARKVKWWDRLAKIISHNDRGEVIFSVDGLEETNHIYRQNVKWNLVERNMKAYIAGGGRARWDYLVFKHNEHQINEAKELAEKWGFERFLIKRTSRFYSYLGAKSDSARKGEEIQEDKMIFQVLDKEGNTTHVLEPPTDEKYQSDVTNKANQIMETQGSSIGDFYNTTKIDAKCVEKQEIYVSARGFVLPCCWMGATLHRWEKYAVQKNQGWQFINSVGGEDAINAIKTPLKYIIEESGLFQNIKNSWDIPTITEGKLAVCTRMCAANFEKAGQEIQFNEGQDSTERDEKYFLSFDKTFTAGTKG